MPPSAGSLDPYPSTFRVQSSDGRLRHDGARRDDALGGMPAQRPQAGAGAARRERLQGRRLLRGRVLRLGLARTLQEMGIRPEQCHAEVGHGNLELSVGEDEALAAADERVMVLEAIRGVAHKMGLETTMAPKPYLEGAGNGHHLHVSLYEGEDPVLFDGSGALSGPGRGLVGGLLEHLPAIMAFTAPSPNSYQRLAPGMWSSAFAAYGLDNREAAIRLASPVAGRESATANVEIKPVDVTSNPYLALAAVLAP